ncbi:MAG: glycosyltransferase [Prevotella sp.]
MNVLHFIPVLSTLAGANIISYKEEMIKAMSGRADVTVLTSDTGRWNVQDIKVRRYSLLKNMFGRRFSTFDKFLSSAKPDVVHIHACWDIQAYYFMRCCIRRRIPVVVTLDRRLEAWHMSHHAIWKTIKSLWYQKFMLSHADALHAVSRQESDNLKRWFPLPFVKASEPVNPNVEYIGIYRCLPDSTPDDMATSLLRLYRKVMDSRPFYSMSADAIRAEDIMLAWGSGELPANVTLTEEHRNILSSLSTEDKRLILLHAAAQGVKTDVIMGANRCSVTMPQIDTGKIERFDSGKAVGKGNQSHSKRYMDGDISLPDSDKRILTNVIDVALNMRDGKVTRQEMQSLCRMLYHANYDEIRLADIVADMGIAKHIARMFAILEDRYLLGQGYMFLEPLRDGGTKKNIMKLYKLDIQ